MVCLWCGRTLGRSVGVRSRDYPFSRMGNLPHFFTHAAPLGALGARELRCQRRAEVRFRVTVFDQLFFAPVTYRLFRGYFWRVWELPKGNERIHGIGK